MPFEPAKLRSVVEELLRENKALTEKQVKAAAAKALRVKAEDVGSAVIRDVRKSMGIDRPKALDHAREMLRKNPKLEARSVVAEIAEKFGIRLGPPDVSRLRPKEGKRPRRDGRLARAVKAPRGRRGARPAGAEGAGSAVSPEQPAGAEPVPEGAGRGRVAPAPLVLRKGEIAMTFEGKGEPTDLARFFLSLAEGAKR